MRRLITLLAVAGLVATPLVARADEHAPKQFVLSPEGNHLWAYDTDTHARQLVIQGVNASNPGASTAPLQVDRRDINGQICVSPAGDHIITGEDTVVGTGGSHDPGIAGWGYFAIAGNSLGSITATQVGKLAPEAGADYGPGYTGDPDNFGCGFLDHNRLVTSAIGNTLPGEPANGQLFFWFGPFTQGYTPVPQTSTSPGYYFGTVEHCVVDDTLATAGGITIDRYGDQFDVYVATNRPDDQGHPGGIWKYSGTWPTSPDQCDTNGRVTGITKTLVIPAVSIDGVPAPDATALTPSSVVIGPDDTLFVSSVFTGTVSEYTKEGIWIRDVYPIGPVAPRTGPTGNTPFGLAFTDDGSLWIADLGIFLSQPIPGQGSLIRVSFDGPVPLAETVQENLTFPDGLGVYTP